MQNHNLWNTIHILFKSKNSLFKTRTLSIYPLLPLVLITNQTCFNAQKRSRQRKETLFKLHNFCLTYNWSFFMCVQCALLFRDLIKHKHLKKLRQVVTSVGVNLDGVRHNTFIVLYPTLLSLKRMTTHIIKELVIFHLHNIYTHISILTIGVAT